MKKGLALITVLSLLSTGMGLLAGCWIPESDTVKNHYKGKDGGYIAIRGVWPKKGGFYTVYLRVRGTYILRTGTFMPTGTRIVTGPGTFAANKQTMEQKIAPLSLIQSYWPGFHSISFRWPLNKNKLKNTCYIDTEKAFLRAQAKNKGVFGM